MERQESENQEGEIIVDFDDLTPEQLDQIVGKVQAALLKNARRNRITIGGAKKNPGEEKVIRASGDCDLMCCGADMHYKEAFGVRRYYCQYRAHHPAIYVRQSDGEMLREEGL